MKSFSTASLRRRPPRTWNAVNDDDVSSCTYPPQVEGDRFARENVNVLGYTKTTGGLTRLDVNAARGFNA